MARFEHRTAIVAAVLTGLGLMAAQASAADEGSAAAAPPQEAAAPSPASLEDGAPAADGPPVFMAVIGVKPNDVLHLRDVPSADSKSLADIPPNARGLRKIGCMRVQLSLDRYMYMTKEERNFAQAPWCRVEYQGKQGWVAARYVREESTAKR